jgi:predicted negative regulator of RcsB-dependent stress response
MFQDEVSSTMLAVLFAIESAKDELEAQNLPQAETVAKASELLQEVVEKISEVLEDKKDSSQQSSQ